ncbi:MAG: NAD(P)H-hydrate epimerase, partial [Lysobacteraceae bacterium]
MHSPFPLYAPDQLRELEVRGIAAAGGDADALMARAGEAAWRTVLAHWPRAMEIVVACGPGNNGGDGFVLARHAQESGRDVRVLRVEAQARAPAPARRAGEAFLAAGGRVHGFDGDIGQADLIVDALFGIGLSRALDGPAAALVHAINAHLAPVLALDVPSGIDARSGHAPGVAVVADRTLQFMARHRGLRTGAALDHCGALELASLDLPASTFEDLAPAALAWRADALAGLFPLRPRDSHKGRNGHVLCIGGDHGSGGAILLAVDAALRVGAGLASVVTRALHVGPLLSRRPEAMVHALDDARALPALMERASVTALGPGLGQGDWGRAMLDAVLASDKPRVLDADA